ncbi:MAG TPA: hypothetical protein VJM33_11965 [Microthrixaceae bacterium]|nr:hypothetical protein [Microthrixaceae bacterium]
MLTLSLLGCGSSGDGVAVSSRPGGVVGRPLLAGGEIVVPVYAGTSVRLDRVDGGEPSSLIDVDLGEEVALLEARARDGKVDLVVGTCERVNDRSDPEMHSTCDAGGTTWYVEVDSEDWSSADPVQVGPDRSQPQLLGSVEGSPVVRTYTEGIESTWIRRADEWTPWIKPNDSVHTGTGCPSSIGFVGVEPPGVATETTVRTTDAAVSETFDVLPPESAEPVTLTLPPGAGIITGFVCWDDAAAVLTVRDRVTVMWLIAGTVDDPVFSPTELTGTGAPAVRTLGDDELLFLSVSDPSTQRSSLFDHHGNAVREWDDPSQPRGPDASHLNGFFGTDGPRVVHAWTEQNTSVVTEEIAKE